MQKPEDIVIDTANTQAKFIMWLCCALLVIAAPQTAVTTDNLIVIQIVNSMPIPPAVESPRSFTSAESATYSSTIFPPIHFQNGLIPQYKQTISWRDIECKPIADSNLSFTTRVISPTFRPGIPCLSVELLLNNPNTRTIFVSR